MMLQDIAEYLEDQTIGTVGTSIFVGYMPDAPAVCIALYEYAGMEPMYTHDGHIVRRPGLQVVARGAVNGDFSAIRTVLQNVENAIGNITNATIEGTFYRRITAAQSISPMGRANQMFKAAQNYKVERE
jgi:hypothetical protein